MAALFVIAVSAGAADTDLDPSFSDDGILAFFMHQDASIANAVALQPDGKIVIVGTSAGPSNDDIVVVRLTPNGVFDPSFSDDGMVFVDFDSGNEVGNDVAVQPDGKIVVVGTAVIDGTTEMLVLRLNSDGSQDGFATFHFSDWGSHGNAVFLQPDGKILAAGHLDNGVVAYEEPDIAVVRLNSDFSLDPTFDRDGRFTFDLLDDGSGSDIAFDVALKSDGSGTVVVAGYSQGQMLLLWISPGATPLSGWRGTVERTDFSNNSVGYGMVLQTDQKPVVVGESSDFVGAARFQDEGGLDLSFNLDGRFEWGDDTSGAQGVVLDRSGKLVVCGTHDHKIAVFRLLPFGEFDPTFGGGWTNVDIIPDQVSHGHDVALQPDGKIVVVGYTWWGTPPYDLIKQAVVVRFKGDEDLIFTDGFEWGSTLPWSATVPDSAKLLE